MGGGLIRGGAAANRPKYNRDKLRYPSDLTDEDPHLESEIVKRPDHAKGFELLPRRWVAERRIACSAFHQTLF